MSAYTSMSVTRGKAIEIWLRTKIEKKPHKETKYIKKSKSISDAKLESFMDDYLEDRLFNCIIVPDNYVPESDLEFFNYCLW